MSQWQQVLLHAGLQLQAAPADPTVEPMQQRPLPKAAKPPLIPAKTAPLQHLKTELLPEQAAAVVAVQACSEEPPLLPPQKPEHKVRGTWAILDWLTHRRLL